MIQRDVTFRVRYKECDGMGIVHHSNYICYYETARQEMLREFGTTYAEMESRGIMMPVVDVTSKYIRPAYYDDILTIRVTIAELPKARMKFYFEIYRTEESSDMLILNSGAVTLAFMHSSTRRPCRAPEWFTQILEPYF